MNPIGSWASRAVCAALGSRGPGGRLMASRRFYGHPGHGEHGALRVGQDGLPEPGARDVVRGSDDPAVEADRDFSGRIDVADPEVDAPVHGRVVADAVNPHRRHRPDHLATDELPGFTAP